MQSHVHIRNKATQQVVSKLAAEFFSDMEKKLLEAELGQKFSTIKFNMREYAQMQLVYPYTSAALVRAHTYFYRYVLSLDIVLLRLRGFLNTVKNLDAIGSEAVYKQLSSEMIHPSFVPWSVLEQPWFHAQTQQQKQKWSVRTWTGAGDATNASALYLVRFPILSGLIAITQGLFLMDPDTDTKKWVNADTKQTGAAYLDAKSKSKDLSIWQTQLLLQNNVAMRDTAGDRGGAIASKNINKAYEDIAKQWQTPQLESIMDRLAKVCLRTGLTTLLYSTLNDVLREFDEVLGETHLQFSMHAGKFVENLVSGPLFGDNITHCPAGGYNPDFVGYDGKEVTPENAFVTVNGKRTVSGMVDIKRSSCKRTVRIPM